MTVWTCTGYDVEVRLFPDLDPLWNHLATVWRDGMTQARIGTNIRPQAHEPGTGAVREGCALL
ncbi:MAG: hypothetical protein ACXV3F_01885, partial [Frankiaceae bacterium]